MARRVRPIGPMAGRPGRSRGAATAASAAEARNWRRVVDRPHRAGLQVGIGIVRNNASRIINPQASRGKKPERRVCTRFAGGFVGYDRIPGGEGPPSHREGEAPAELAPPQAILGGRGSRRASAPPQARREPRPPDDRFVPPRVRREPRPLGSREPHESAGGPRSRRPPGWRPGDQLQDLELRHLGRLDVLDADLGGELLDDAEQVGPRGRAGGRGHRGAGRRRRSRGGGCSAGPRRGTGTPIDSAFRRAPPRPKR